MAASFPLQSARPPVRDWVAVRGLLYWRGRCDLAGGFPGFAQHGGFLTKARVQITANYFLVEEGRAGGFGLPLQSVTSAFVVDLHERGDSLVRLQYLDGDVMRTFTVRFCGPFAALRPGHRARQMLRALQATGTTQVLTSHALPEPELLVPWATAQQLQHEPVHWYDRAHAPIVLGESVRPSDVWLTAGSLIWGCGTGSGINRLPLDIITDVIPAHVEDRTGTPAVYVGFTDDAGRRHEVPFLFSRAPTTAENEQREVAMLNALRAHGIPLGFATGRSQPWRIDFQAPSPLAKPALTADDLTSFEPPRVQLAPLPLAVPPAPPAESEQPPAEEPPAIEIVTAEPADSMADANAMLPPSDSAADMPASIESPEIEATIAANGTAPEDTQAADQILAEVSDLAGSDEGHEPPHASDLTDSDTQVEPEEPVAGLDSALFPRFRQIEAMAMANLATMLQEIDDCLAGKALAGRAPTGPTPTEQSLAYHELADAAIAGQLTWEDVRQRRARLTAIIEATPRLRTLVELHASGHLDDAILQRKRLEVKNELSSLVMLR